MLKKLLQAVSIAACCLLVAAPANADDSLLPLWRVEGRNNTVYLLGSVHLLRASDHPLPAAFDAAYRDAETLVMELDMDDMDPLETQTVVAELSSISDGRSLSELLGRQHYTRVEAQADKLGIPIAMFAASDPWYVAITLEQLMLMRAGLTQQHGVESHFVGKAGADGKEILGLETIEAQLGFLDGMSLSAQRDLLMQVIEDGDNVSESMDTMIRAWRHGDVGYLEENMLEEMQQHREVYRAIVTNRNKSWVRQITRYLNRSDDFLVIVGTLHLIGDDGVPELLRKRGYTVEQIGSAGAEAH